MTDDPVAPPSVAVPPAGRGLVFSSEGGAVVSSLATWMRILSTIYYVGLGLVTAASCGAVVMADSLVVFVQLFVAIPVGVYFGLGARWLRAAASGFERGMLSDDEIPLGQGFRSFRAFLVLSGVVSGLILASHLRGEWM
jgi:hypothetical protein